MRDFGVVLFIVAAGFVAWLAVTNRLGLVKNAWESIIAEQPGGMLPGGFPAVTDRVLA